ncbi:MAG: hypothetical protein CM1200mP40_09880 [Gammaproteobacteria bacterium]|nr:MAG: hypothetical protein CM1200mP40_09880 [Gammaproteobacteria bacterium]GIT64173.1 MAG: hypothetical protein Ct9H300mP22_5730 [Gammaproteobacteria bacterium]
MRWVNGANWFLKMSVNLPFKFHGALEYSYVSGRIGAVAPGTILEDNVVEIGLWLHPEGYEEEVGYTQDLRQYNIQFAREERDLRLVIPPHGYQMTQGFHSFDHPVRIDSFQPHGHLR